MPPPNHEVTFFLGVNDFYIVGIPSGLFVGMVVIGIGNIGKNGYRWNPSQNVPLTLTDLGPCASQDVQSFISWPITVCVTVYTSWCVIVSLC